MALRRSHSSDIGRIPSKGKIAIFILALVLLFTMGGSIVYLWNKLSRMQADAEEKALALRIQEYTDAGEYEEAFELLNQALEDIPEEVQASLAAALAKKEAAEKQKKGSESAQQFLQENAALQNRQSSTETLDTRLSKEQDKEQREKKIAALLREGQAALLRSRKTAVSPKKLQNLSTAEQKTRENALVAAEEAKDKALQVLQLDRGSEEGQDLLAQAAEAILQQSKGAKPSAAEMAQLRRELFQARSSGDNPKTDRLIEEILSKNPSDSGANTTKAQRIIETRGETPQALQDAELAYRKALGSDPAQGEALAGLAQNLDKQKRFLEAVPAYEAALEESADIELLYQKGIVLYRLGKYKAASQSFQGYLAQDGKNLRVYYTMGLSYMRLLRKEEALAAYQKGLAKGLRHAATYWELAKLQLDQDRPTEALENINAALALKSGDTRYLQTKGLALFQLGHYEEAASTYAEVRDSGKLAESGRAPLNYNLGLSYHNSTRYSEAEAAFGTAISLDSNKPEYVLALVDSQVAGGKDIAAEKTLVAAEKKFPANAELSLALGNILLKTEKYEQALAVLQRAYAKGPTNQKIINNLGLAYVNAKNFGESRTFFLKAIENDPDNSTLWFNLALVDVATERHPDAIQGLEQVLVLDEKMSEAYYLLAKEYLATGKKEEARETLNRLRWVDPHYSKIVELEKLLQL